MEGLATRPERIEPRGTTARGPASGRGGGKPDRPVDLGELLDAASALMEDAEAKPFADLRNRLAELRSRLAVQLLNVAILGQFKRGKSTVLNALLGVPLLPTAVVPVTALPTHVEAGPTPRAVVSFRGDRPAGEEFSAANAAELQTFIQRFVAEEANPDNRLNVASVRVFLPAPVLGEGIVLIDTPGIGSTLRHNTEATLGFLPRCDVALFVVSVDPPMTQAEAEFLATVVGHVPHLVFVLNKVDQIAADERPAALAFLRDVLAKQGHLPPDSRIFCVSARQALEAKRTGDADLLTLSGFAALETYLTRELALEKSQLLRIALARKADAILAEGLLALDLALRSLELPLADLEQRAAAFDRAAADFDQQRVVSKDLLAGDRNRALDALEAHAQRIREQAARHLTAIIDPALSEKDGVARAQAALAAAVPQFFDEALRQVSDEMSHLLDVAFNRHQQSADALVEGVRAKAAELFDIPYRPVSYETDLRAGREPYWVTHDMRGLFDPIAEGALFSRLLGQVQRGKRIRRALLERIDTLVRRNVENIRWALRQNIDDTFRRLGAALDTRLADMVGALQSAIGAARAKRQEDSPRITAEVQRLSALSRELARVQARVGSMGRQCTASS